MRQTVFLFFIFLFFIFSTALYAQSGKDGKGLISGLDLSAGVKGSQKGPETGPVAHYGRFLENGAPLKLNKLYVENPNAVLAGNPCVMEFLLKEYGLVFVQRTIEPKFLAAVHNLRTNLFYFFKYGPFWKAPIRRQIRNCKLRTGDYKRTPMY